MINFRIFNTNYLDRDILANDDVSSENASFPVSNIYNKQRRSKIWRSEGYFEVTALNNQIIFEETNGVPLTATIAIGSYSTIALMSTAIQTALEAAGASGYIVSQSNYLFTYTSDGFGGGGIFNLLTTNVSFTAYDLLGLDNTADKTGSLFYSSDFVRIHSSEWIKWDMGISTNPTTFFMISKRNQPIKISPAATIKLQGSETDNWISPSYEQSITYDDEVMSLVSDIGLHTEPLRYWRLLIIDRNNPQGYIELGAAFLGNYFSPQRGRVAFPLSSTIIDRTETVFSEGGQSFSDIREKTQQYSFSWYGLEKQDVEELEIFFENYGTGIPFFISMDTAEYFSTSRERRIIYCKFSEQINWTLESPDNFGCDMVVREEL